MNVIVTGGAGFIGSHTCVALVAAGHRPIILDDFSNASADVVERIARITGHDVPFVVCDVRDRVGLDAAFTRFRPDAVIHFAALKSVEQSMADAASYYDVNVGGTATLLACMASHDVRRLVFSSSATVYDPSLPMPVSEDGHLAPINPYGRTKLACERMIGDICAHQPMSAAVLRYFNPVGAHESGLIGEDPRNLPTNVMPVIADVALGKRNALSVFGDDYPTRDGTGVRDYIHVCDLAEAHVRALELPVNPAAHILNVGTGRGYTVLELVQAYRAASGQAIPVTRAPRRNGDAAAVWAKTEKAERVLEWRATRDIHSMCADSWRWASGRRGAPAGR